MDTFLLIYFSVHFSFTTFTFESIQRCLTYCHTRSFEGQSQVQVFLLSKVLLFYLTVLCSLLALAFGFRMYTSLLSPFCCYCYFILQTSKVRSTIHAQMTLNRIVSCLFIHPFGGERLPFYAEKKEEEAMWVNMIKEKNDIIHVLMVSFLCMCV